MKFVLVNKKNNKLNQFSQNYHQNLIQPISKNYKMGIVQKQPDSEPKSSLRNMFSLIKFARTSCGSCRGTR